MFGLYARLAVAFAIVLALGALFWKGVKVGEGRVHAEWAIERAERTAAALKAEQEARAKEQELQAKTLEAVNAARKRENVQRVAADGAKSELDRLRYAIKPADAASSPRDTLAACAVRADTARELLGRCSEALTGLAGKADRHASDALTLLQAWPK